jgi:hypothetical protein
MCIFVSGVLCVCVIKGLAVRGNVGVLWFHTFLTSPSC